MRKGDDDDDDDEVAVYFYHWKVSYCPIYTHTLKKTPKKYNKKIYRITKHGYINTKNRFIII